MMIFDDVHIKYKDDFDDVCIKYEVDDDTFRPGLGIEVNEEAVRKFHVPIKN